MNIREAIKFAMTYIDSDPSMSAYILRDYPETEAAELRNLAWLLASREYGCHKNDVLGLVKCLEMYLRKVDRVGDRERLLNV